jgi:hypothetical protein
MHGTTVKNIYIYINFTSNTLYNIYYKHYNYYKQNKYCATCWKQNLLLLVLLFHCDVTDCPKKRHFCIQLSWQFLNFTAPSAVNKSTKFHFICLFLMLRLLKHCNVVKYVLFLLIIFTARTYLPPKKIHYILIKLY